MFLVSRHYACLPSKIDLHCTDLLESVFKKKTISNSRTKQPGEEEKNNNQYFRQFTYHQVGLDLGFGVVTKIRRRKNIFGSTGRHV